MDFWSIFEAVAAQTSAVSKYPVPFLAATCVVGWIIWKLKDREYSNRIADLQSKNDLASARIDDYEKKLSGASPSEARSKIEDLEKRILELQPKQRFLTDHQKSLILGAIIGVENRDTDLSIIYPQPSPEAALYAYDFSEVFQKAGWNVDAQTLISWQRVKHYGISIGVGDLDGMPEIAQKLADGLRSAEINFSWVQNPYFAEKNMVRLFVDMIEP